MIKYPKKPKASASVATKENYLARIREIDKENANRRAENNRSAQLSKHIAGIRQGKKTSLAPRKRKKKSAAPKSKKRKR